MNSTSTSRFTLVCLGLVLLGSACATNRPPRQRGPYGETRERPARTEEAPRARPEPRSPAAPAARTETVVMPPQRPETIVTPAPRVVVEPLPPPRVVRPVPSAPVLPPVSVEPPAAAPRAPEPRTGSSYTIRRGETLSGIAARHGLSTRQLADYNRIADPNSIRSGQVILIPGGGSASAPAPAAPAPRAAPEAGGETIIVQAGDSLGLLARRHNTTVADLRTVNNLRTDTIRVGQRLTLPKGSAAPAAQPARSVSPAASPAPEARAVTPPPAAPRVEAPAPVPAPAAPASAADDRAFEIVVEEGDTLESISQSYWIPLEALRRENNLGPNAQVTPGQSLRIPPTTW